MQPAGNRELDKSTVAVAGSEARQIVVPALPGMAGVMKDRPSDYAYGLPRKDGHGVCEVAVGRFPARTVEELRGMVRKTLNLEREGRPGAWRNRLVLVEGNPGAGPLGEMFVEHLLAQRLEKLHAAWSLRAAFDNAGSPYYCPGARLREAALECLQGGELFSIYLGHSRAAGLGSLDKVFLTREDWAGLKLTPGQGVFFTCGCFGCQLGGSDGEGYGLAAMRNPAGPVAVIGASGESYSAAGLLAVDGLLQCCAQAPFPARLADYWLAVQAGLAQGPIDDMTFTLLDQSDGTGGKVPLSAQRLEDLEMWMLLGDPALRLPVVPVDVSLEAAGPAGAGRSLTVNGALPADTPENRAARDRVAAENCRRANQFVLASATAAAEGDRFKCSLAVPANLPWPKVVVRAYAEKGAESGQGVSLLPVVGERASGAGQ
jgi:hypothetical protein